jgi:hypothetical protein
MGKKAFLGTENDDFFRVFFAFSNKFEIENLDTFCCYINVSMLKKRYKTRHDYFYFKQQDLSENAEKKDFNASCKIATWRHVPFVIAERLRKFSSYYY